MDLPMRGALLKVGIITLTKGLNRDKSPVAIFTYLFGRDEGL
jgi:hypothetical protein